MAVDSIEGYELPWYVSSDRILLLLMYRVEKYRPSNLDDIVGNQETVDRLKIIARDGNMPHLIISVVISLVI